jgi:hypothetical protein
MRTIILDHQDLFILCYYHFELEEAYLEISTIEKLGDVLYFFDFSLEHKNEIINRLMKSTYKDKRPVYLLHWYNSFGYLVPEKIII